MFITLGLKNLELRRIRHKFHHMAPHFQNKYTTKFHCNVKFSGKSDTYCRIHKVCDFPSIQQYHCQNIAIVPMAALGYQFYNFHPNTVHVICRQYRLLMQRGVFTLLLRPGSWCFYKSNLQYLPGLPTLLICLHNCQKIIISQTTNNKAQSTIKTPHPPPLIPALIFAPTTPPIPSTPIILLPYYSA